MLGHGIQEPLIQNVRNIPQRISSRYDRYLVHFGVIVHQHRHHRMATFMHPAPQMPHLPLRSLMTHLLLLNPWFPHPHRHSFPRFFNMSIFDHICAIRQRLHCRNAQKTLQLRSATSHRFLRQLRQGHIWRKTVLRRQFPQQCLACRQIRQVRYFGGKNSRLLCTCRSKRPARTKAGSSESARFVAAMTKIPSSPRNPPISFNNWLMVWRELFVPPTSSRFPPTASNSSMNTIHGAYWSFPANNTVSRAFSKSARTRLAPTPTSTSSNSDPATK